MAEKKAPKNAGMTNQRQQGYGHAGPRWAHLQEGHAPIKKGHAPVNMQTAKPPPPPPPRPAGMENVGRAPKK
jgi:hypothetical protein